MKRCPTCQRTFDSETQKFCAHDGTPLVADEPARADEPLDFDPEATVLSSASKLKEEAAQLDEESADSALAPTQYFDPNALEKAAPEPSAHQSYPPPEPSAHQSYPPPPSSPQPPAPSSAPPPQGGAAAPPWPPTPQPAGQAPPQQSQQPYYPQAGPTGAPPHQQQQWPGGPPPQQQPPWMPPGQQPQAQGQAWGAGGYYPQQPGQYAPQNTKSLALSLVALIVGIISFFNWVLLFSMYFRIIPPDRSVAEVVVYVMLVPGILAVLLGIATLVSSRWRAKALAVVGMLLSLPGIIFFIYLAAIDRLP